MSGVDGAVKLNSLHAPSVKNTGTEKKKSVSAFAVEKTVEEFVKELIETPVEEFIMAEEESNNEVVIEEPIEEIVEEPINEINEEIKEPIEEIIEVKVLENLDPIVIEEKPKKQKKNFVDIRVEFEKLKDFVFKMYEIAFDKTPSFSPTKEQTVGDLLLYLSKKLSFKNADSEFNLKFGLEGVSIPSKYDKTYIPLALKLAKWCEDNKVLSVIDEMMFLISSLYLNSALSCGVIITELEIAIDFENEINYSM